MQVENRSTALHTCVGIALLQWRFFWIGGVWLRSPYSADAAVRAGLLILRRMRLCHPARPLATRINIHKHGIGES